MTAINGHKLINIEGIGEQKRLRFYKFLERKGALSSFLTELHIGKSKNNHNSPSNPYIDFDLIKWSRTPQGFDYWNKLDEEYMDYEMALEDINFKVDLDDTLCYFLKPWIVYHNEKHGEDVKIEDIMGYHGENVLYNDSKEFIPDINYDDVELIPEAQKFMEDLVVLGNVTIVTTSCEENVKSKTRFIKKYFPFCRAILCGTDKTEFYQANDIVIDDALHHCETHSKAGGYNYLYTQDCNLKYNFAEGVKRWSNYSEILTDIKSNLSKMVEVDYE